MAKEDYTCLEAQKDIEDRYTVLGSRTKTQSPVDVKDKTSCQQDYKDDHGQDEYDYITDN